MRSVVVLLRRGPRHRRTVQGLRAAVGYLSAGLRVTVVLCGPAREVLDLCGDPGHPLHRPIHTLRQLGHTVIAAEDSDVPALLRGARAIVTW